MLAIFFHPQNIILYGGDMRTGPMHWQQGKCQLPSIL